MAPWKNAFSEETGSAKFFSTNAYAAATDFISLSRSSTGVAARARISGPYRGAKTTAAAAITMASAVVRILMVSPGSPGGGDNEDYSTLKTAISLIGKESELAAWAYRGGGVSVRT